MLLLRFIFKHVSKTSYVHGAHKVYRNTTAVASVLRWSLICRSAHISCRNRTTGNTDVPRPLSAVFLWFVFLMEMKNYVVIFWFWRCTWLLRENGAACIAEMSLCGGHGVRDLYGPERLVHTVRTSGAVAYRGGVGRFNPPKFRRSSKIVPKSTQLWKLLKIANLGCQHRKMFGKKAVKF